MTRKENLLNQAVAKENQLAELTGKAQFTFKSEDHRRNLADKTTVYDLQERIKRAEREIEAAKQQAKLDAYYATEEGKAFKAHSEARKEELRDSLQLHIEATGSQCKAMIKEYLGEGWDIIFGDSLIEIGLLSDDDSNRRFIFGHSFELRFKYDYKYGRNDNVERYFKLDLNYGCMGGFDPLTDKSHTDFIIGLGKFAAPDFIAKLKGILQDLTDSLEAIHKEYCQIEDALKAPKC